MSTMPASPASPAPTGPFLNSSILDDLLGSSPDFEGAVLVTRQGEVIARCGGNPDLMLKLAPFAVGLLELSERAADEAGHGDFGVMLVESGDGHLGLVTVDDRHIVFALTTPGASMGLIRHDLSAAARELETKLR